MAEIGETAEPSVAEVDRKVAEIRRREWQEGSSHAYTDLVMYLELLKELAPNETARFYARWRAISDDRELDDQEYRRSLVDLGREAGDALAATCENLLTHCPKCNGLVVDEDGFGVLFHLACGYCSHPSSTGGSCEVCGTATSATATDVSHEATIRAAEWLEHFRDVANPVTTSERWEYLDQAAVHVEQLLGRLSNAEAALAATEADALQLLDLHISAEVRKETQLRIIERAAARSVAAAGSERTGSE